MKLATAIEFYLTELQRLNYSPRTIKGYKQDLLLFKELFESILIADSDSICIPAKQKKAEICNISQSHIELFLEHGIKNSKLSSSYRNRKLSCLRSFFTFLERLKLIEPENNPTVSIKFAKVTNKKPSPLSYAEYLSILEAVKKEKNEFLKIRNWAIIVMLYNTGLRLSELAGLNVEQANFTDERLIAIKRKGNRIVDLPINRNVIISLNKWLIERNGKIKHTNNSMNNPDNSASEQALFITAKSTRISTRMIEWLVKRYAGKAGIERSITPHTFRHSYCTEIQKRGAGMYVAKELMDHSTIKTTSRYSHANEQAMRMAVDSLIDSKQWLDD